MQNEIEITIPYELAELLLIEAAEREVSVEEIVAEALKKYLERSENHAR